MLGIADSKLVCHKNVRSLSHALSTLKVEGKALHPFLDYVELPFFEKFPLNLGLGVTGLLKISVNKNCKCRW